MRMSPRSIVAVLLAAATIMVSTIPMQASEPERVASAKATYSKADLLRNLGGRSMILTTDSKERVTFKVNVDEEGDVTKLTYSHNVTSRSAEAMTQYRWQPRCGHGHY